MLQKANASNIQKWIQEINTFNSTPGAGTTRILFTEEELASRDYIKSEMKQLGLQITEDAIGNIYGTLEGSMPELAPVWTGSHIDTVPNAGMFDGMAGIVSGMESLRLIRESGIAHKRNLVVIVYTSEEPTRFGLSCLGSRAMAGVLSLEDTKKITDESGKSLYEVLGELGYRYDEYERIKRKQGEVHASVELHIEQNRHLEQERVPVGIVQGICAPTIYNVTVSGCQSHAGGTSMDDRHDAFAAASELSLALERITKESEGTYVTGTVGRVHVTPNAVNVIPGQVQMSIDIRSIDVQAKETVMERLLAETRQIETKRGVTIEMKLENDDIPLTCDEQIKDLLRQNCDQLGIKYLELISGPYHDSLFVGRFAPAAMLFVPSKDGISHSKEEWTDFEDIALGTDVLAHTLLKLANS